MTDQPEAKQPDSANSVTNVSGGVNANAERIDIGGDAVGRDKVVHIEHYHAAGEAVPSRPKVYHNLPQPDYAHFVGRERELSWLRERLSPKDRAWQIAITGMGGVGKSALALTIAREYLEHYAELPPEQCFQAIIWVSAKEEVLTVQGRDQAAPSGLILKSLEDVYAAIAQTLDREDITRAASAKEQDRLVQKVLGEYRTLLVMDNLESVTDERIRPFLRYLPGQTKAVITSREWVEVADVLPLRGLTSEEAEQLLTDEAVIRNVTLSVIQQGRLVDLTSGLPLPLKLSVARIASGENFEAVARWLGNAVGDVPEYCVQGQAELARQRDPNAWSLFLAVSLFDRNTGASREALGKVADLSIADLDAGLAQLQRLFLVNRTDNERFWLLPIVQRYATAKFASLGDSTITDKWLAWLLSFARNYGVNLDSHFENYTALQVEYPNLRAAIQWCMGHAQWDLVGMLAEGTWTYPYVAGLFNEFEEIIALALQASQATQDMLLEGKVKRQQARIAIVREQHELALQRINDAALIAQQLDDDLELGLTLTVLMDILCDLGRLSEAEEATRSAMKIGEQLGDMDILNLAVYRMSVIEAKRGDFQQATAWLDKAYEQAKLFHSQRRLSGIMARRGMNYILQGDLHSAEQCFMQALEMDAVRGERRYIAHNKFRLATIYYQTDRLELAWQTASEAMDIYERCGIKAKTQQADQLLQQVRQALRTQAKATNSVVAD